MPQAETSATQLIFKAEGTYGETPAGGVWATARITGESLEENKSVGVSAEIRADGQITAAKDLSRDVAGDINFELVWGAWDLWFEALARADFTEISTTGAGPNLSATNPGTFTRAAGSFVTDGYEAGMWVKGSGWTEADNNKIFKVITVAALTLTVANGFDPADGSSVDVATEAADAGNTLTVKNLRNGTTKKSLVVERQLTDLTDYLYFNGLRVDKMSLDITADAIITGSFSVVGKSGEPAGASVVGGGSITAAVSGETVTASGNVGNIYESATLATAAAAALATAVRSAKFTIANNPRLKKKVGSKYPFDIGLGNIDVTGTLEVYFEDITLYSKFRNHTSSGLQFIIFDDDGQVTIFTFFKVEWTKAAAPAPGQNEDIMLPMEFRAIMDPTTGYTYQIDQL